MELIKLKDINYYYRDGDEKRFILKDINTSFELGKLYVILGDSGSGKTTLLSLLAALDDPKSGEILFDNHNIKEMSPDFYRRNKLGIIFQSYNLIPYMTAHENVLVAMGITDNKMPEDKEDIAYNLLDYIGINKSKASRKVNSLSGGEQQRVAIARALATNVDIILADEPTGNLDEDREKEIIEIFKKLVKEHNKCVILVTHSKEVAKEADVILNLRKGKLQ